MQHDNTNGINIVKGWEFNDRKGKNPERPESYGQGHLQRCRKHKNEIRSRLRTLPTSRDSLLPWADQTLKHYQGE
jgi:hypothetical protein